jgi:S-adenosylmethionine synthetase
MTQQETGVILANDTSCGVGYAPLSLLEKAVHAVEGYLSGPAMKCSHPEIGEDIKVMGVRCDRDAHLAVALAPIQKRRGLPLQENEYLQCGTRYVVRGCQSGSIGRTQRRRCAA